MRTLLAFIVLLAPLSVAAAEQTDVILPDRAGAARSAGIARPGEIQLELGLQFARERAGGRPTQRRWGGETTLTVGLTDRLEIAVDAEPLVRLRGADEEIDVGNVAVGIKSLLYEPAVDGWPVTLSVQPFIKLPVAQPPIGSGRTDVGLIALAGLELPGRVNADLNAGLVAVGQPDGWLLQALLALGVARPVGRGFTVFSDLFYATRAERDGSDFLGLDAGLIWAATADLALDASLVTSLAGTGLDWAVRAGVSVRFGR